LNKTKRKYISTTTKKIISEKHHTLRDSEFGREGALVWSPKKNNKPRVEHEPHSAHGRAVKNKKNKPRVNHEPRSAYGRAVKNEKYN